MMQMNNMQEQIASILGDATSPASIKKTLTIPHAKQAGAHFVSSRRSMNNMMDSYSTLSTVSSTQHQDEHDHVAQQHTTSMAELDTLLDGLVNAVHVQLQQEKLLDKCIAEQVQAANNRHAHDNQLGVILSMNKVHRMNIARERVNLAIQLLEGHIQSIESQLEQLQQRRQAPSSIVQDDDDMEMAMMDDEVCIDISAHRNYAQQVDAILSAPLTEPVMPTL